MRSTSSVVAAALATAATVSSISVGFISSTTELTFGLAPNLNVGIDTNPDSTPDRTLDCSSCSSNDAPEVGYDAAASEGTPVMPPLPLAAVHFSFLTPGTGSAAGGGTLPAAIALAAMQTPTKDQTGGGSDSHSAVNLITAL